MLSQVVTNQAEQQREIQQDMAATSRISYQLKGVARVCVDQWKKSRAEGAPIVRWVVFEEAFMGLFFPRELREAKKNGPTPSSASAPAPRNKGEYKNQNSQNFRARPA
ncbi:hypothetical protein H5410_061899 [Solanum commersonii]|uniref:Uncharacterized protein n=1 Tax=Solanum commersonii TaxID=4109 RepID=A0A9J5W978_SOLCO|nr:hypothetical protein H5410_061899 [Solanum commersonii]